MTVSIALLVAMVLFFGSFTLFGQTARYVLFFDQSVNGLAVGSPVKFRGVPVGSVERILIRVEGQDEHSTSIPVIIKIDRSRLTNDLGTSVETFGPKSIHLMIERGLIAQLNVESLITGQLFVEFSMQPGQVGDFTEHRDDDYGMVEIPTLGSSLYQIANDLGLVISALAEFDFERFDQNLNEVLVNLSTALTGIDSALAGLDTPRLTDSFTGVADEVTGFLQAGELDKLLVASRSVLEQVETTVASYDLEDGPFADAIARWTTTFEETLAGVDQLVADSNGLLEPESSMRVELETSLRELGRAAQSLRFLADYLKSNPNALITGRPEHSK